MGFNMDLQLFADGAAAGSAAAGAGATPGETTAAAAPNAQTQSPAPAAQEQPNTQEQERAAQYAALKEQFKEEFDADMQKILKGRLRKSNQTIKDLTAKLNANAPILDRIARKYGVDREDAAALLEAYEQDDDNYTALAYAAGVPVEQYRVQEQLAFERQRNAQLEADRAKKEQFDRWTQEAADLQQIYPDFDFGQELENEGFLKLMDAGVDLRTAYEVAHHADMMRGAMQFGAAKAATQVTNRVLANQARPAEAGTGNPAAAVVKTDISKLTRAQMDELITRARRGERITLQD